MGDAATLGTLSVGQQTFVLRRGDREYRVDVGDDGTVTVDGGSTLTVRSMGDGEVRVRGGAEVSAWSAAAGDTRWVYVGGEVFEFEVAREGRSRAPGAARGSLSAPMPASVVRVEVAPGDRVRKGDALVVLEAMKMELPVRAPADGIVAA
ncbi:MAG: acetyl-CoA/propionyl-CoA carboxylase, biotin carboxylase, biotin carboxyl carrier protein, partial [Acidobacteriota bacterium]